MPIEQNFTGTSPQYIAPFEVVVHNTEDDCWVSLLGKVLDVTPLIKEYAGQQCVLPLIAFAGKDISHWFDEYTGDIQYHVHPVTGVKVPYCPHGKPPHVPPYIPTADWAPIQGLPWWKDPKYVVGLLTKKVRPLRVVNTEICKEYNINVCSEDKIMRIMERYSIFNQNASSYCWKFNGKRLQMNKTLEENGIPDEREEFARLGLPANLYIPAIYLYYIDDFKWIIDD